MILIKNGKVVNSNSIENHDVLLDKSTIIKVGPNLVSGNKNCKIIDAVGCYVLPGGIDPHVHMNLSTPLGYSSDNFKSGSNAALYGGTTSIIDFVTPKRGENLDYALSSRIDEAKVSETNYSFHISLVEWHNNLEKQIKKCIKQGYSSFKVYMAYKDSIGLSDSELRKVMNIVGKLGGLLLIHCELGDKIDVLRNSLVDEGKIEPCYHPISRPAETESEAVRKAIDIASTEKCPIYIVHVSTKESVDHIRIAQSKGQPVFAETCPQYLILDDTKYKGEFDETSKYVMSPPLRKQEDSEALWNAISDGTIGTIGTDHCPFTKSQKEICRNDFRSIPNGVGGVEHRLALVYTYGVLTRKISINKFVEVTSTNASKLFGLFPAKGVIKPKSDADLVVWDPDAENIITASKHHQNCDFNVFEGVKTTGCPKIVIKNGKIVVENC